MRRFVLVWVAVAVLAAALVLAPQSRRPDDRDLRAREVAVLHAKAIVARDVDEGCGRFAPPATEDVDAEMLRTACAEMVGTWKVCRTVCDEPSEIYPVRPVSAPVVSSLSLSGGTVFRFQSTPNRRYEEPQLREFAAQRRRPGGLTARQRGFVRQWEAVETAASKGWFCVSVYRAEGKWAALPDQTCGLHQPTESAEG